MIAMIFRGAMFVALFALVACAFDVRRVATELTPNTASSEPSMVVLRDVSVTPSTGYTRTLKATSVWTYVGRVPQGKVYAIKDDVFMLEGRHMHEAYCVVTDGSTLVGFYLPVEQAFAPLSPSVKLPVNYKQ